MSNFLVLEETEEYRQDLVDYDGLWKKLIMDLFEEFVLYFSPDLYEAIDFTRTPNFLEQELYNEIIKEKKGKKIADKIVKVFLKDGKEKCIFIHIEIKGHPDSHFSKRMFQYYYRIYDRFDCDVYAIALLTDLSKSFQQSSFQYSFFGTEVTYKYQVYKFLDQDVNDLKQSSNPFALAVLAGIYLNQTKQDNEERSRLKLQLLLDVLEKGHYPHKENHSTISALFYFIDYLMKIPENLTKKLRDEIMPIITKEGKYMIHSEKVPSPTLAEVLELYRNEGIEKGIEKGRLEERRNLACELIRENFSNEKIARMTKLSIENVTELRGKL